MDVDMDVDVDMAGKAEAGDPLASAV